MLSQGCYLALIFLIGLSTFFSNLFSIHPKQQTIYSGLWAQTTNQDKIAVLPILNQLNLKAEEINFLTNEIQARVQLKTRDHYQVMSQKNIIQHLTPDKQLEDCIGKCEVEIGRLLGAKLLIVSQFLKFGNEKENLRLSLKLYEIYKGSLISYATIKGANLNDIEEQLNQVIEILITDGLNLLKSQEFKEKFTSINDLNRNKNNATSSDDLNQILEQLNQVDQKDDHTPGAKVDYESELKALEAESKRKEAHQKQVEAQWQKVLAVVQNKKVTVGKKAVQLFINEYNQHPLGNPRMKDAVNLLDQLTEKEAEEKKKSLEQAHLAKVRISYEAAKSLIASGDEKGKKALDLFLEEFENHPFGNPLKDEALVFYEEKKKERDDAEKQKHLKGSEKN